MTVNKNVEKKTAVVVGGGVIGLACAHFLEKSGFRVRVIDQGKIGAACSHANCGYVSPSHVLPLTVPEAIPMAMRSFLKPKSPFKIKFRWNSSHWNWMVQFAKRCKKDVALTAGHHLKSILDFSIAEYRKVLKAEAIECEWRESGLLYAFETKAGLDAFRKENDLIVAEYQHGAREVTSQELPELDPVLKSNLAGGFIHEEDASLRPDLLNHGWRKSLEARGAEFAEDCALKAVVRSADGNIERLDTSTGPVVADHYVFAIGAWSESVGKMTGFKLPIQPGKGYSVTVEKPVKCPSLPMLFPEKKVGISPFRDGFRIGSMMEFVGFDDSIPDYRIRQLKESVQPFFDFDLQSNATERWTGFRPMTYDPLPVIGRMPKSLNGFIATGHSMLGVSMAPATGKLISEIVAGQNTSIDVAAFDPARFAK